MEKMTPEQFEELKEKIESAKENKNRAEGAIAKIEELLKSNFNANNIDEAKTKLNEIKSIIKKDEDKFKELITELEKITSWDE